MTLLISAPATNPNVNSFFGVSVGTLISGCLMAAFIILAIGYGFFRITKMHRELHLVSEDTKARKDYEEELAAIGSKPTPARQRRDPWE